MFVGITNTPRDYAWGSTTAIADLFGLAPSGRPEAELWLGAHPGSPSTLVGGGGTLLDVVDGRLPFLLKVLAAASPLSLQAHPTPIQAAAGFAREEAAGIPLDAPERNYKDAFHKPEVIYALSDPFLALAGFRPVAETRAVLQMVDDPRVASLAERLSGDAALRPVFEWLIRGGEGVDQLITAVVEASAVADGPSWATVRRLADAYPDDAGIVISLLLHTIALRPGEVLYLPAGNIHAYLDGLGIELMAASDNVLRGGLSRKHIDVQELLDVLDFRPLPAPYLRPEEPQLGVQVFRPDVDDFMLTVVTPQAASRRTALYLDGQPAIALAVKGAYRLVSDSGDDASLMTGQSLYIRDAAKVTITGGGLLFIASSSRL